MRLTLRALSALLGYPSAELQRAAGEIRAALAAEGVLGRRQREALEPLLASLEAGELLDVQATYTDLFDRSRKLSLHLFEHVHGESRERGPAMIDLGQLYVDQGFVMASNELPDYLPLFLEFASCQPPEEAQALVAEPAHVIAALGERLAERGSHYAAVFEALLATVQARPDPEALEAMREQGREEDKPLDEEWEEAPVEFGQPSFQARQAAGVVSRIRATQAAAAAKPKV